jgi:hypothetical protein
MRATRKSPWPLKLERNTPLTTLSDQTESTDYIEKYVLLSTNYVYGAIVPYAKGVTNKLTIEVWMAS